MVENFEDIANKAAYGKHSHLEFLEKLVEGESLSKQDRSTERKIKQAKFPVLKTLSEFDFTFPKKINETQVKHFFHLNFINERSKTTGLVNNIR